MAAYAVRQEGVQMTPPLSVQLYALGAAPVADPAGVIARLAALGYEAVEPLIQTGTDEALVAAWLARFCPKTSTFLPCGNPSIPPC